MAMGKGGTATGRGQTVESMDKNNIGLGIGVCIDTGDLKASNI